MNEIREKHNITLNKRIAAEIASPVCTFFFAQVVILPKIFASLFKLSTLTSIEESSMNSFFTEYSFGLVEYIWIMPL